MIFIQRTITCHERSSATLTNLFMIFRIATNKTNLFFEDYFVSPNSGYWTEESFQISHPFKSWFICQEKKDMPILVNLRYVAKPRYRFSSLWIKNDFDLLCKDMPKNLFSINNEGRIELGSFFDKRFKITTQLTQQLVLQDMFPSQQFAKMLWRTIMNLGGLDVLHQIYREQLDQIEYELRFAYPMEDINLLSPRKHR